jgi:hypothetical protein
MRVLQDSQVGNCVVISFAYEGEAKAGGSGVLRKCYTKPFNINKASSSAITEPPFAARLWNAFGAFP